jgi:uncharacterized lipoprotein YmbA
MRAKLLVALALLAGCSSPSPELYTLAAMPGPTAHLAAHSIEVRRIGLAGYLDRPTIVRSSAAFRLRLADNQRWGEPLGGLLDRVFAEDLVERLPDAAVFSESGAISTAPDLTLEVDVQRFDADADGTLVLLAQVAIRRGDAARPAQARTLRLTARPAGPTTRDHVAAMSRALADLADKIVALLADSGASG